jgi:hypothetical protein
MPRRKILRLALYVGALLALLLGVAEGTYRMMGHQPWQPGRSSLERVGGGPVFEHDSVLGYRNVTGAMKLRVNGQVDFTVTHDAEGHRFCGPRRDSMGAPKIWVLGCSFAHGYGVNDPEAFPWLLQQSLPSHQVTNFGTDGYGPHQSLLQVQRQLANGDTADLVVLCYGGFHNQRVVCSPFWQKAISGQESMEQWQYPFRRKGEWGKMPLHYSPFYTGCDGSSALNALDNAACAREETRLGGEAETETVIRELDQLVRASGGTLLVAGIWQHPDTQAMLDRLHGIPVVDASPDPSLTILPGDLHPNAAGHQQIANAIFDYWVAKGMN